MSDLSQIISEFETLTIDNDLTKTIISLKNQADSYSELSKLIDLYLIPQESEKKQNAEISTPSFLRQEMLDQIPADFWKKPRKVLEPCSGKGGFLLDIIDRFIKHLPSSTEEKYRLIVEECLYWSDINSTNVFICQLLLNNKYRLNYYCGDALDFDWSKKFDRISDSDQIFKFDLVVGNPPYNDNSGNKGVGHNIWTKFITQAINVWLDNGYLLFVNPSGWRQYDNKILRLFQKYQLHYLEIHDEKDGMKTFNCGTRYDWYLLEKVEPYRQTRIKDQEGKNIKIYLNEWDFIPNFHFAKINELLAESEEERCQIINDRSNYECRGKHMSKIRTEEFCYPCVYAVNLKENKFYWSSRNDRGHFGIPKVIYKVGNACLKDPEGKYALTQWCTGIVCPAEEQDRLVQIYQSQEFKRIKNAVTVSQHSVNVEILQLFKERWWLEI